MYFNFMIVLGEPMGYGFGLGSIFPDLETSVGIGSFSGEQYERGVPNHTFDGLPIG